MYKRGENMLREFFDKFYDRKVIPKSLEQLFKIRLEDGLKLGGKIDRVDETKQGRLEIIDYKTGRKPSDKRLKNDLQMTVYALAAADKGIYDKKPEDVTLTFYFLESKEKYTSQRTSSQMEEAKKKILDTAKEISSSDFRPKVGPWCDFCDFRLICEAWQE